MSDHANNTYIADDGDGPELWRRTKGAGQDDLLLTYGDLRAAVFRNNPSRRYRAYRADVDRIWGAIAATVTDGGGDAEPTIPASKVAALAEAFRGHEARWSADPSPYPAAPADVWCVAASDLSSLLRLAKPEPMTHHVAPLDLTDGEAAAFSEALTAGSRTAWEAKHHPDLPLAAWERELLEDKPSIAQVEE